MGAQDQVKLGRQSSPGQSSRRAFLVSAAVNVAGVTLCGCRSGRQPSPASSTLKSNTLTIIDTHTHFYDPARPQGVPWPPRDDLLLYRTVLPKDYLALPTAQPVTGTVVVEASPWVEDNQWVLKPGTRR